MAEHVRSTTAAQQLLEVSEASDVAHVRRIAAGIANRIGFDTSEAGNLALIATELATNVVKHAKRGRIIVRPLDQGQDVGVELVALDQGPGIRDLAQAMCDGFSSAGSPGTGLGAIKRLSTEFDLYSVPHKGTAVLARLWSNRLGAAAKRRLEFGVVCLPKPGEEVSGDGWGVECLVDKMLCIVADGLGHGPDAAMAARAAVSIAQEHRDKAPAEIVERAHGALRSTRGAAVAAGEIDLAKNRVRFCGVGNIAARIVNDVGVRHLVSLNGIVGQEIRKITEFSYPWSGESTLIMHSDGLSARWDNGNYPALTRRHPALIAAVLYRDVARGRDDMTALAARELDHRPL
jgi:anti-sigma regulatory factor (Ser/Thr protein kinase)